MSIRESVRKTIKYLFYMITTAQAILGLVWLINNFTHVYMWPETAEYLDIAWNFKIDEYIGIIYPFLVKYFYYIPLYVIQLVAAFVSAYLFFSKGIKLSMNDAAWGATYLTTFPLLLQFHLSVRPESLRLSAVLLIITFLTYKKRNWKRYVIVVVALVALFGITKHYQEPGSRGRIQKTFWSAAFQRFCTDSYSKSYAIWDERTQDTYDIWESMEIIKKSDNMMYVIGPAMDEKWGFEAANESYKYDALASIRIRTREVCETLATDLGQSAALPYSTLIQRNGTLKSQTGRNYEAFSLQQSALNSLYWYFGIWASLLMLVLGGVRLIISKKSERLKHISWELLATAVIQWIYKTFTTGDAVDYARFLTVIAFWLALTTHMACSEDCDEAENMVK